MIRDRINKPIGPEDYVYVVWLSGWGFEANYPVELDRRELDQYNCDPDLFAAKHFGFDTADEYREWIDSYGIARCSERIKSGRLCKCSVGGPSLSAAEWRELDRRHPCAFHAKRMEAA